MAKKKKAVVKEIGSLDVARKAILKKYGEGVISPLGDHEDLQIDSVSTGSLALDSALGVGGLARGRLHEVYGPNSSSQCVYEGAATKIERSLYRC
jgi:RecA/RadA recombinase